MNKNYIEIKLEKLKVRFVPSWGNKLEKLKVEAFILVGEMNKNYIEIKLEKLKVEGSFLVGEISWKSWRFLVGVWSIKNVPLS